MASTLNGTIVGQDWYTQDKTLDYVTDEEGYAGKGGDKYYVYILQFKTPTFNGSSKKTTIGLSISDVDVADSSVRYAICTSDENHTSYLNQSGEVSDSTQVTTGVLEINGLTSAYQTYSLEIDTTSLKSATTYYLYLWGYSTATGVVLMNSALNHTVTITCSGGIVYIDNGTKFEAYVVYIDNGSSWDQYIPYIDNGSGWDECV